MTISELVSGLDREEIELLAREIVARLEGRSVSVSGDGDDPGSKSESVNLLLEKVQNGALTQDGQPEPGYEKGVKTPEGAAYFSLRREAPQEPRAAQECKTLSDGQELSGRGGDDMQRISDFFMRDSRRYDSGFERY